MPSYDFRCVACGNICEITRPAAEDSPVACPACGADTKQVFHPVGVHFKGSGFHNTDYRPKPAASEAPSCPSAGCGCEGCPSAD